MTDLGNDIKENNLKHVKKISGEAQVRMMKEPEQIINLAKENTKFFKDQYGGGYALVKIKDHCESIPLGIDRFKWYLTKLFYDHNFGIPAGIENINNAIQYLQAKTEFESSSNTLNIRVAKDGDYIYYDLTDDNWNCVRIDKNGWDIIKPNFPLFRRYNQTPQVLPNREYDSNVLNKFMALTNIKGNDDILLVKCWIICTVIPEISHTILNIHGGQDAGKTLTERLIKLTVDPDKPENLLSINPDKMEFIQQLAHHYLAFYDNLKFIPPWLPDEICRAVTGGGSTKRALYTNEGDVTFEYKRCLGFNGINMVMNEPDVLRRSLIISQESISEENKVYEHEIFTTAEALKPQLLGYIFDIISEAISIKDSLRLKTKPGMADFAQWGEAISRAMGYPEMAFIDAYRRNIQKQNQHVIDTHPLAKTIKSLYDDLDELKEKVKRNFHYNTKTKVWSVSMQDFYEELGMIATSEGIDTRDSKIWAHSPGSLSNRLNIINTNLRSYGIDIVIRRSTTNDDVQHGFKKGRQIVEIRSVADGILGFVDKVSEASEPSEPLRLLSLLRDKCKDKEIEPKSRDECLTSLTRLTCPICGASLDPDPFYVKMHKCEGTD